MLMEADRCTLCGKCVEACYAEAREILGREITAAQVLKQVERDIPFYDQSGGGVTFSGGEPLMQPTFLRALLKACKVSEIHTAVDTCGFASWSTIDRLRPYVDLFLYDLKLVGDALHRKYTGVSNEVILGNLRRLARLGHNIYLRLPIIPGINDTVEDMRAIGAFAEMLPDLKRVDLLPYHRAAENKYQQLNRAYALSELRAPTEEKVSELAEVLRSFGLTVHIGG
jgi:pyruvate formate lyase activating enzyme